MFESPVVYCDTSFFAAALNVNDQYHQEAKSIQAKIIEEKIILMTSRDIINETATLLLIRGNLSLSATFLEKVVPLLEIVDYDRIVRKEIIKWFKKFNRGKRVISFTDATSYVIVKYLFKNIPVLSFDRDFLSMGLNVVREKFH